MEWLRVSTRNTLGRIQRFACPCLPLTHSDPGDEQPGQEPDHAKAVTDETAIELAYAPKISSEEGPPVPPKDTRTSLWVATNGNAVPLASVPNGALHSPQQHDFAYDDDVQPTEQDDVGILSPRPSVRPSRRILSGDRPAGMPRREPLRKAVLIGILYTTDPEWESLDTPYDDVMKMKTFLLKNGYQEDCILIVSDYEESGENVYAMPTIDGIRQALSWLVEGAGPGDYLFLHYSGHGHQIKADNLLELDGMDEVIIPLNSNEEYIKDNELHILLVHPLPPGCRFMAVFDCCHAGTMLDLPYEHDIHNKTLVRRITPGGPSTRYQIPIMPRPSKTLPHTDNRIKTLRTVKRCPTSKKRDTYEWQIAHTFDADAAPGPRRGSLSHTPHRMDSIPDEDVCPGTILEEQSRPPSRASTLKNTKLRFSICASPIEYDSQRYFGSEHGRASPDAMSYRSDRARSPRPSITSPTEGHPEAEPLNFFTSRADTFAHYNDSGGPSAQVISIAACHDHQTVFEVTQEDATAPNKIRNIGGLLTNTFIEFMEQSKQQKTLDEMLHFLSDAFSRETEKIHKYCCKCQKNVCNDEVCKTPTEEAASRGQCVSPDCPIPTFPPNPLVTTLTDKRRQTLITL